MRLPKIKINQEHAIYMAMWTVIFLAPLLASLTFSYIHSQEGIDWHEIGHVEEMLILYFAAFVIHNFFLAPILLYKRKTSVYLVSSLLLVAIFFFGHGYIKPPKMHGRHHGMPPSHIKKPEPPERDYDDRTFNTPSPKMGPAELTNALTLICLMGMNLGVKLYFKSAEDRKRMKELEKDNLRQQLNYLHYQISPHFFMNTMNNIHALVDIDPERAKSAIVELSKLMRHVLYDCNQTAIPVNDEVQFLRNYIELMKMRFTDRVQINTDFPTIECQKGIAPLMLSTFIENAFKHGISNSSPSRIDIYIRYHDDRALLFVCKNTKQSDKPKGNVVQGGVGLENVRRRLDLLYGDNYRIDIKDTDACYKVRLLLPLVKTDNNNNNNNNKTLRR